MSMSKDPLGEIPEATARVVRAAFKKGNIYTKVADELGTIYNFDDFTALFPAVGQPAKHPVRLALVVILQFVEGLSDRAVVDAVRARMDWKYLLRLDLEDPGFDFSVLSEFRTRLAKHEAGQVLFNRLIDALKDRGLVKAKGKQRTDSTHVFASIRLLNRLELVHETMRCAIESLATVVPDWISEIAEPAWYERYAKSMFSFRAPKTETARQELAKAIGADGFKLLDAIDIAQGMQWLREIPAVITLRKVWDQQYERPKDGDGDGLPRLLELNEQEPCAERIVSPHDLDARFSKKQDLEWKGYKVHLTETCDQGSPRFIVNVQTTLATEPDWNMLPEIHESLKQRNLLPAIHLADTGYVCANSLVLSQKDGVQIVGPPVEDKTWQAQEGGFDISYFQLDWTNKQASCPNGKVSKHWTEAKDGNTDVSFDPYDCYRCPYREVCARGNTKAGHPKARHLHLKPQAHHEALQSARQNLKDKEFWNIYKERAGIEGTISQAVRRSDIRHARYVEFEKVSLQQTICAIAINFTRLGNWLLGTPLAKTRNPKLLSLRAA